MWNNFTIHEHPDKRSYLSDFVQLIWSSTGFYHEKEAAFEELRQIRQG